jgi:hypothetical protein
MKSQEEFFHVQIENIHKATEDKVSEFERLLQEERAKARQCDVDSGTTENRRLRCVLDDFLYGANVAMSVFGMEELQIDILLVNIVFVSLF